MELSLLSYPNKSHRKIIRLPEKDEKLAELLGIIAGDGGINNNWQVVISLNSLVDADYSRKISALFGSLFNIEPAVRKRKNKNCLVVVASSTELVDFLVDKGSIRGNKILQNVDMPEWVAAKTEYAKAFIRGGFNTDGCTYYDRHKYKNEIYYHLGLAFTNKSAILIKSIVHKLIVMGYHPTVSTKFTIMLRREKEIFKFFQDIIPSNLRHWEKFNKFLEEYRSGRNGTASKAVVRATGP